MPAAERSQRSSAIVAHLRRSAHWKKAKRVLLFHPLRSEPDISPLLESADHDVLLPRVTADGLDIHLYRGAGSLRRSSFGMLEPDPDKCPITNVAKIDLAVVPGIAFDPDTGARLGRGGGYYDRLLADEAISALTIGVAFGLQLRPGLPAEAHDRPVDYLATESGLAPASASEQEGG